MMASKFSCAVLTVWSMMWNWLGYSYRCLTQTERAMEFVALFELNWKEGCRWTIKRDRRRRTIFFLLFYFIIALIYTITPAEHLDGNELTENSAEALWIPNAYILMVKTGDNIVRHLQECTENEELFLWNMKEREVIGKMNEWTIAILVKAFEYVWGEILMKKYS